MWSLKAWRRERILARHGVADAALREAIVRLPLLDGLEPGELERLRELAVLFLHEKSLEPIAPLEMNDTMRLELALQACLPILHLGIDWYAGWRSIVVYPTGFIASRQEVDEAGVVHASRIHLSGESWLGGPVILAWSDIETGAELNGYNLVIHEFAHKLDMLNGDANGMPPLHRDMAQPAWTAAFADAFKDLEARLERGEPTPVDDYAAESPAECFAVFSEAFFELPHVVRDAYPDVHAQLVRFYRQDPAARLPAA